MSSVRLVFQDNPQCGADQPPVRMGALRMRCQSDSLNQDDGCCKHFSRPRDNFAERMPGPGTPMSPLTAPQGLVPADRRFVNQHGEPTLRFSPLPGPIELCCRLGNVSSGAKQRSTETSSEGAMEETPRFLVNKHASTGASPVVSDEKHNS